MDLYRRGSNYGDDRIRIPSRRPQPYPRRRPRPHRESDYDHLEDTVPDSVGSPDLLDRIEELKRLQGRGRYPDPHKNDFYDDMHNYDKYHSNHYYPDKLRMRRPRLRSHLPPKTSKKIDFDSSPLPPFNPSKEDLKKGMPKGDED